MIISICAVKSSRIFYLRADIPAGPSVRVVERNQQRHEDKYRRSFLLGRSAESARIRHEGMRAPLRRKFRGRRDVLGGRPSRVHAAAVQARP